MVGIKKRGNQIRKLTTKMVDVLKKCESMDELGFQSLQVIRSISEFSSERR